MAYKFVKFRVEYPNPEMSYTSQWLFMPTSIVDECEFFEKYTMHSIGCCMDETFNNFSKYIHEHKNFDTAELDKYMNNVGGFTAAAWMTNRLTGGIPAFAGHRIAIDLFKNRCNDIKSGLKIYHDKDALRNICPDSRYTTIVDECYMDELQFPDFVRPTLADVKYIMWNGGQHWYAKVEKMDVVVNGEQKWNTKDEAMQAARKFIDETWPLK